MLSISFSRIKSLVSHCSEMSDFGQMLDFIQSDIPHLLIKTQLKAKTNTKKLQVFNGTTAALKDNDTYLGVQRHRFPSTNNKNVLFLGDLKRNPSLIEIYSRDITEVYIDLNVLKKSEIPNCPDAKPSGLTSEEFAQLARYLGFCNNITQITISNADESFLQSDSTLDIVSEFIWYFAEGTRHKIIENPQNNSSVSIKHLQHSQFSDSLILLKSKKSDRCWIRKGNDDQLIPCTSKEYAQFCNDEIPSRFWDLFIID